MDMYQSDLNTCSNCHGEGKTREFCQVESNIYRTFDLICGACNGEGMVVG